MGRCVTSFVTISDRSGQDTTAQECGRVTALQPMMRQAMLAIIPDHKMLQWANRRYLYTKAVCDKTVRMVTLDDYTRDILEQIRSSYDTLLELDDKPGDLVVINREWLRVNALLRSLVSRIGSSGDQTDLYSMIHQMAKRYLDSYYFAREIENMMGLYSNDPGRLRNIRIKIIESLHDKKFIDKIDTAVSELQ